MEDRPPTLGRLSFTMTELDHSNKQHGRCKEGYLQRILVLVPHEPDEDPRVRWVIDLCRQVGRTDVLGFTWLVTAKPSRQYDGQVFVERVFPIFHSRISIPRVLGRLLQLFRNPTETMLVSRKCRYLLRLMHVEQIVLPILQRRMASSTRSFPNRDGPGKPCSPVGANQDRLSAWSAMMDTLRRPWQSIVSLIDILHGFHLISSTLFQRARAASIVPRVVLCHDLYALLAGVRLKRLMGCPVIYDSHEVWPEAYLQAGKLEQFVIALIERRAITKADVVITVTPQIARHLERQYGVQNVLAVPNAEPFGGDVQPSSIRPATLPVRFLLQGRIVPGRGFEDFLRAWARIEEDRAVLILRAPMNEYFRQLCDGSRTLIDEGRILIADAVAEDQLVGAASEADVGVIPYRGPNLNHVYACPNKLSQYMQAGLAILCSSEMEYVSEIVSRYECGLNYDPSKPEHLREIVRLIVNDRELLSSMKENAHKAACTEYNWAQLSRPYRQAIEGLFVRDITGQCR